MSKLLFVFERDMPTVSIMRNMFNGLKNYPAIQSDFMYLTDVKPKDIDVHDIIIFIRPDNKYSYEIAKQARISGHLVVTFCDDDLLNLPKTSPTIPWRKAGLIKTLGESDVIWSSSRYILNNYRDYTAGKRTAMVDTIVQSDELADISIGHSGEDVRIVYAAAPSHAQLFERYISPIIPDLVDEFGDKIDFTFVGVHPEVTGIKCNYYSGMPLVEYREFMKSKHFDIGVAPLLNDDFSKCKYFNKFLEYTTHGIVGIYTETEPYSYVVEDHVNGFLVENTPECWYRVLADAISHKALRYKCVENAIEYLNRNHTESACMDKVLSDIPEMLYKKRYFEKCRQFWGYKFIYRIIRSFDLAYLTIFYLKSAGAKNVLNRALIHMKEVKAYTRK